MNKTITKKMKMSLAAVAALFFCGHLQAADLLVPSQYPDIQSAYQAAAPFGDFIRVDNGIYSGPQNTIVASNKDLRIVGTGSQVVFDLGGAHQFITTSPAHQAGVYLTNVSVVNGPASAPSIQIDSGVSLFQGCRFSNHRNTVVDGTDVGNFTRCTFSNNSGPAVIKSSGASVFHQMTLRACEFSFNGGVAVDVTTHRLNVDESNFEANDIAIRADQADWVTINQSNINLNRIGLDANGCGRIAVNRSRMHYNLQAISAIDCRETILMSSIIAKNGLLDSTMPAVKVTAQAGSGIDRVNIVHCTIADNVNPVAVDVDCQNQASSYIHENIFWNPAATSQVVVVNSFPASHNRNCVLGGGFGLNVVTANPRFLLKDTNMIDYTLSFNSPLRDLGVDSPGKDLNGISWNQDGSPDIGAIETCRHISSIHFLGMSDIMFYGSPGEPVGLILGAMSFFPTPTPFGDLLLNLNTAFFTSQLGTLDSQGCFRLTYASTITSDVFLYGQGVIGTTFTPNIERIYLP